MRFKEFLENVHGSMFRFLGNAINLTFFCCSVVFSFVFRNRKADRFTVRGGFEPNSIIKSTRPNRLHALFKNNAFVVGMDIKKNEDFTRERTRYTRFRFRIDFEVPNVIIHIYCPFVFKGNTKYWTCTTLYITFKIKNKFKNC